MRRFLVIACGALLIAVVLGMVLGRTVPEPAPNPDLLSVQPGGTRGAIEFLAYTNVMGSTNSAIIRVYNTGSRPVVLRLQFYEVLASGSTNWQKITNVERPCEVLVPASSSAVFLLHSVPSEAFQWRPSFTHNYRHKPAIWEKALGRKVSEQLIFGQTTDPILGIDK
jgi:hypothetical protein